MLCSIRYSAFGLLNSVLGNNFYRTAYGKGLWPVNVVNCKRTFISITQTFTQYLRNDPEGFPDNRIMSLADSLCSQITSLHNTTTK